MYNGIQNNENLSTVHYSALAGGIFATISRLGLCTPGNLNRAISCSNSASYAQGSVEPINLDLDIRGQQSIALTVRPETPSRGSSFTGASARLIIANVFERVDINSRDENRFSSSFRTTLSAVLHSFNVPDQILDSCRSNNQGIATSINGTNVSCRFFDRPSTRPRSEFILNLARRM